MVLLGPQISVVNALPLRDLSQSAEAQRTPYSQRESSANTESSVKAATESSLFDFVKQWKAYEKQISARTHRVRRPGGVCRG